MNRFDTRTIGAPTNGPHHQRRLRAAASVVAGTAGAAAALIVGFTLIGGVAPATWVWIAVPMLVVLWATGLWWRWDSPDHRNPSDERERRGF